MVTISESKKPKLRAFSSSQFQYAVTYVLVTLVVLLFLNIYCATVNEELFRQNKQTTLSERTTLAISEIRAAGELTPLIATQAVNRTGMYRMERVVIADCDGKIMYDRSLRTGGQDAALIPELEAALQGEDSFSWSFEEGIITAVIAAPIKDGGKILGGIYILDVDDDSGRLLQSLHTNIFTITLVLEIGLIAFAIVYVHTYSRRLKKITSSMHIIQEGDFSHKVELPGHDELSLLADEFNYLTERLQISENKRRQFVSDASHELKTPLASIKLLSDSILQYDMDMETVREFAGDIGNEADRLNRMTQKLLALTKNESDTANADAEIIYMAPTVERVVKMLSGIAQSSRITITTDLREDTPVLLQEDDLYQITFNLVENGIKYNIPGGSLSISLHRQEDMAVLRISDTGVGIPPESINHVFERFYRVDKARSRQSGGSGLGLAIVRAMVERNNGEIHLQSTVGKGTTFTVAFPCFDLAEETESEETP